MWKIVQKLTSLVLLVCLSSMLFVPASFAAPTVKIVVNPNQKDVSAGSEPIALTAQAAGSNLKYRWTLNGPGKLDNAELPGVFYTPPESLSGQSAQAVITVTVRDQSGQETTESLTFNILPKKAQPAVAQTEIKKGMGTGTKVAIGVGAAALVGGGIVLATQKKEDDSGPFSGNFKLNVNGSFDDGAPWYGNDVLKLKQKENLINGTWDRTRSNNCCTFTYTVAVSGTVNENRATISSAAGKGRCDGTNGCAMWMETGVFTTTFTLINDGKILHAEWGDDFVRLKRSTAIGENSFESNGVLMNGDFVRE